MRCYNVVVCKPPHPSTKKLAPGPMSIDEIMAHHEAGHAVAALALGIALIDVSESKTRIRNGALDLSDPYDLERDAIFTLAGEKAEERVHEDLGHTSEKDQKHFAELCVDRYPHDPEERFGWSTEMHRKTDALLEKHWSRVTTLAAQILLEKRALSVGEVIQILKWPETPRQHAMAWDK